MGDQNKHIIAEVAINSLIAQRKSPRAFSAEPVTQEELQTLFEAARWAASAMNEQPWRFIYATKENEEAYNRLLSCLAEPNQVWAKDAPVLMLTVAKTNYSGNNAPNSHAWHDIGLATANLVLQATELGLHAHMMGGYSATKAREVLGIPAGYEPVTMLAIGHIGDPEQLPEQLKARELAPRTRKPLEELVHEGVWQEK
ncbi:nitroreductase family protein [Pontibacter harenae]|uniref:nitroreductase family protein n=1 Tax=Pontibacter harenae TaxID=2894083 RepID=UPI001E5EA793|nr:nitroreductase family protein [Pontibacter harenae]MCC9166208.1 nitroreductase family protein [Pontibacter harenae]